MGGTRQRCKHLLQRHMDVVNSSTRQIEPFVGVLHVVGGARVEDVSPRAGMLERPPRADRPRGGERLFTLLDLAGPASPHLYRELREVVAQTYWSTAGSITAALRRAAAAANNHLFRANLHVPPPPGARDASSRLFCAMMTCSSSRLALARRGSFTASPSGVSHAAMTLPHSGLARWPMCVFSTPLLLLMTRCSWPRML